jgi:integrase
MAFLRQYSESRYWYAGFTLPDGRRVQRSTKRSDRKKAQEIADKWEKAAKLAAEGRLSEAQSRSILSDIYEMVSGEPLLSATTRDFMNGWAEKRKSDTSLRTQQAYAQIARDFLASLGDRAKLDICQVNRADVAKYRDSVLKRTSVATANKALKYLRVALGAAYKDGLIHDNPAAKLDVLKRSHAEMSERRPFTIAEMKTVLTHATGEWKGIILFGLYTGQRLKDIARLTWNNIDLESQELRFVTAKTGRRMVIPLATPLAAHMQTMTAGDDPSSPLFPDAFAIASKAGSDSRLSQQFHGILVAAGMAKARTKEVTGAGHGLRRTVSQISFHSLRHTATSLLKNAGVPESVAMDIIGHDSEAISRHYTHVETSAKRSALQKLPNLL